MNCPNCNNKLSCGCQQRTASDGSKVCTSCLTSKEAQIIQQNKKQKDLLNAIAHPVNQNFAPTGVGVKYNPPQK